MVRVELIIDLVTPEVGRRRVERMASLPGVPAVGQWIDTVRGPTLALTVTGVRWNAIKGSVVVFLGAGERERPGMTDRDGELELRDYMIDDLREAGWTVGDYD